MIWVKIGWTAGVLVLVAGASGQSINIDINAFGAPPEGGGGSPSASFGGAGNSPGLWNSVDAGGPTVPTPLLGLDGQATTCSIIATGGTGSQGGYNNPNLSGDFRAVMGDYEFVGTPIAFHFSGFTPGRYLLYTLGATTQGTLVNMSVNVPGSSTPTQIITGPMPANQFIQNIDFSTHDLVLTSSNFEIDLSGNGPPNPEIHGFQIVRTVPEPITLLGLLPAVGLLARRRRRSM